MIETKSRKGKEPVRQPHRKQTTPDPLGPEYAPEA